MPLEKGVRVLVSDPIIKGKLLPGFYIGLCKCNCGSHVVQLDEDHEQAYDCMEMTPRARGLFVPEKDIIVDTPSNHSVRSYINKELYDGVS